MSENCKKGDVSIKSKLQCDTLQSVGGFFFYIMSGGEKGRFYIPTKFYGLFNVLISNYRVK